MPQKINDKKLQVQEEYWYCHLASIMINNSFHKTLLSASLNFVGHSMSGVCLWLVFFFFKEIYQSILICLIKRRYITVTHSDKLYTEKHACLYLAEDSWSTTACVSAWKSFSESFTSFFGKLQQEYVQITEMSS